MKVRLLRDCDLGPAGRVLSGPSVWRLCFPVKGCKATPADPEAMAAMQADLATVSGGALERVRAQMANAGVMLAIPEIEDDEDEDIETPRQRGRSRGRRAPVVVEQEPEPVTVPPADEAEGSTEHQDAGQAQA